MQWHCGALEGDPTMHDSTRASFASHRVDECPAEEFPTYPPNRMYTVLDREPPKSACAVVCYSTSYDRHDELRFVVES